jgi:hypothetical protein
MKYLPMILTALLIVITDPYKDIKYDQVNVYEYTTDCKEKCIGYYESEGWKEETEEEPELILTAEEKVIMQNIIGIAHQINYLNSPAQ